MGKSIYFTDIEIEHLNWITDNYNNCNVDNNDSFSEDEIKSAHSINNKINKAYEKLVLSKK